MGLEGKLVKPFPPHGLFKVRLDNSGQTASRRGLAALPPQRSRPARTRAGSRPAAGSALRRYCSGCARETEHVSWPGDAETTVTRIRWPAAKVASGTTICRTCGELLAPSSRPMLSAWSRRPRTPGVPAARRNGKPALSVAPADEGDAAKPRAKPQEPNQDKVKDDSVEVPGRPGSHTRFRLEPSRAGGRGSDDGQSS
jgi:hypothetical protein